MFLKWALRVPVVWWYSITQLLLRISPLLSLKERNKHIVSQYAVMSAVTHSNALKNKSKLNEARLDGRS